MSKSFLKLNCPKLNLIFHLSLSPPQKTKLDSLFGGFILDFSFSPPHVQSNFAFYFSSVQLLSHVRVLATPWIAAHQASLSITNSWSSLRLTSIESVMPSSHLILCRPLLLLPQSLPASESFPMSQLFAWGSQSIGVSALASVLSMNIQVDFL